MPHELPELDLLGELARASSFACSSAGEYAGLCAAHHSANPTPPISTTAPITSLMTVTHTAGSSSCFIFTSWRPNACHAKLSTWRSIKTAKA